ncbi:hypothetical protein ACNHYB_08285 [Isoptericola jiangsuensis]|uniref:hypothetical protein n=1 Tax=Isoptericola jiangsuensis TaxID=548579 RepID=UPI003AAE9174
MDHAPDSAPVELGGGNVSDVVRIGDTVHRTAGPWTPTIHALLAWVRAQGVDVVPAPLGVDAEGREVLSWLPGEVAGWPVPHWVWDLGTLHDGVALVGFIDVDMASPGPRAWDLAYLGYRMCGWCEDMPAPDGPAPAERLETLLDGYGRDLAPEAGELRRTMVGRLHELADWTEAHARVTGRQELFGHATMYRRDADRLR